MRRLRATAIDPRFVGRDRELALLGEALAGARAGRRQTVFVTGEAGIGKTALVRPSCAGPRFGGDVWMAQGRCVEQYGTGEAYLPILEALEHLAARGRRRPHARGAPALRARLAGAAALAGRTTPTPSSLRRAAAEGSAQRMLREIAQALEVLAADKAGRALARRPALERSVEPGRDRFPGRPARAGPAAADRQLSARRRAGRRRAAARPGASACAARPGDAARARPARRSRCRPLSARSLRQLGRRCRSPPSPPSCIGAPTAMRSSRWRWSTTWCAAAIWSRPTAPGCCAAGSTELGDGLPDDLRHLVHDADRAPRRGRPAPGRGGRRRRHRLLGGAARCRARSADVAVTEDRCTAPGAAGAVPARRARRSRWPDGTWPAGFGFLHALYWQGTYERVPPQPPRRLAASGSACARNRPSASQCAPIAAELAMRFEVARDFERSLRYLQMAGASALSRCAYRECIELIKHALSLVVQLPAFRARQIASSSCCYRWRGPDGVARLCLERRRDDLSARALALRSFFTSRRSRARLARPVERRLPAYRPVRRAGIGSEDCCTRRRRSGNEALIFDALAMLGQCCTHLGDLAGARRHLEHALALPVADGDVTRLRGKPRVAAYLAWVLWFAGYPTMALRCGQQAMDSTRQAASPHSTAIALGYVSLAARSARRPGARDRDGAATGRDQLRAWPDVLAPVGGLHPRQGRGSSGRVPTLRDCRDAPRHRRHAVDGGTIGIPNRLCALAEAELKCGKPSAARQVLAEGSSLVAANDNALFAAELMRLDGEAALADTGDSQRHERAEESFRAALALARRQGARSLELRAATSLAALLERRREGCAGR